MRKWFVASALLHILICILLWLGLPQFQKPLPEPPAIIPVEIAELAPMATAKNTVRQEDPKPEVKPEPPKPVEKPPEPPKPPEPKPPEPKPEPPKPAPPQPAEKPEPPKPVEKPPTPEPKPPEPKAEAIPAPTQKPKPPDVKPKAEPKPDPLSSILKNVAKLKNEPKPDIKKPSEKPAEKSLPEPTPTPAPPQKEPKPATSAPSAPNMADRLSMSEVDALKRQISGCWNVPVGAKGIENISVEIYIQVNPDRTLKEAKVVDQGRMASDPFFRAVAESALRAIRNPRCSPLALPPEKYQEWQETTFNFNPKDMF